jgi:hypothetical protein
VPAGGLWGNLGFCVVVDAGVLAQGAGVRVLLWGLLGGLGKGNGKGYGGEFNFLVLVYDLAD